MTKSWRHIFALRKIGLHTELSFIDLKFDSEGGPISMELACATYSHAPRFPVVEARLKLDGIRYSMRLKEPINAPTNFQFAVLNTYHLCFIGQYVKAKTAPTIAFIDVKVRLSDGSRARLRKKIVLGYEENLTEPIQNKEGSQKQ